MLALYCHSFLYSVPCWLPDCRIVTHIGVVIVVLVR